MIIGRFGCEDNLTLSVCTSSSKSKFENIPRRTDCDYIIRVTKRVWTHPEAPPLKTLLSLNHYCHSRALSCLCEAGEHQNPTGESATMVKRISFRVYGRVQGVSFRYFTQRKASSYNITGWVRNTDHGEVQGEAQGEDDSIEKLVAHLKEGPRHAHVTRLDHEEISRTEGENDFDVRR